MVDKTKPVEQSGLKPKPKKSQDSLRSFHARDDWMADASRTSAEIVAKDITSSKLIDIINNGLNRLKDKHSSNKPNIFSRLRGSVPHNTPKRVQSYEITGEIIGSLESILNKPDNIKRSDQLKEIALLTSLAKELWAKGYRNREDGDQRLTKDIESELAMYQKTAHRIKELEEFLHTGKQFPEMDGTLALRLEQVRTKKQTEYLLNNFGKLFHEAAKLIQEYRPTMQLVEEAATAGAIFGGHGEKGWAYTETGTKHVYVPPRTDPILAMRSFLFELHNAKTLSSSHPAYVKGALREIDAEKYACMIAEEEVEAKLRMADIWTQIKPQMKQTDKWQHIDLDEYNDDFCISIYQRYKDGKVSKEQLVEETLQEVYQGGIHKGKTARQVYTEQYPTLHLKGKDIIPVPERE